ncbi:hypothetical protein OIU34_16885 [Pararhizobium sp. BT-229]|uniref:hypothetical protein n=1 Tax=Pararhizobium sp. BT-229 TaxID=2986923 RepID=UPI0021F79E0A|nr:hypothetical protein [Pararhizobium sp. BT-229]MCV9963581.1 hypothetical protein [Pararhizobium sp. BT-229]
MTRTVRFPMSYSIHGRLPGRVMPRSYIFAEMVDLQVTDVAAEDAPVAVSWKVPHIRTSVTSAEYRPMWAFDAERRQHTVFYEGRHWVRLLQETHWDNSPSEPLQCADFERAAVTGAFNGGLGFAVPTQGQRKFEIVTDDQGGRFEEVIRHGRPRALELASGLDFISVNGVLHARADQPCFKLVPAWYEADRTRVKTRYPVVDTKELRAPRTLDPVRVPALPLSMRDEVTRKCPQMWRLADQFEWPTIHMPESLSTDEDLRLEADYLVHEFLARTENTLGTRYAGLEHYFRQPTVEAKLDYLLANEREWPEFRTRYGVSTAPLRRAVEALDNMSISLVPDGRGTAPALS